MQTQKPPVTATTHVLPYEQLAPRDFEQLCLWLIRREGFEHAEHIGAAGGEQGRDIRAKKEGNEVIFQCKRVKSFGRQDALHEIEKILRLPIEEHPTMLVFLVTCDVSVQTRNSASQFCGDAITCTFWASTEFDEKVKRYPDIVNEFFHITQPFATSPEFKQTWTVPYRSLAEGFIGRQVELDTLHGLLQEHSRVGVVGMGGLGKTQLAVEYACRYRDEYPDGVYWLNAANPLLQELAALAETLCLAQRGLNSDQAAYLLRDHLNARPKVLLVFDNLDDPASLNQPLAPGVIPAEFGGRTLFTTRRADFPANLQSFEIKVLSEEHALHLLLRGRPVVLDPIHPDHHAAREIVSILGGLPLALELAASYFTKFEQTTFPGYLDRLRQGGLAGLDFSLKYTRLSEQHLATRHSVALGATLETQWQAVVDDGARQIFMAAGQLAAASWIPAERLALLCAVASQTDPGIEITDLDLALHELKTVSLVEELTGGRLRLHPLVHDFARGKGDARLREKLACNLSSTLKHVGQLEMQVRRRGVDEVIEDLSAGLALLESQIDGQDVRTTLEDLHHVLDREAHHLRDLNFFARPAYLLQQIAWRAHVMQREWLAAAAELDLESRQLAYLKWRWGAVRESPGLLRILRHDQNTLAVAMTGDGKKVISGSSDGTLRVWDLENGKLLWIVNDHQGSVSGIALANDGRLGISGSSDHTLILWDIEKKITLQTVVLDQAVSAVALSEDGSLAAVGLKDGTLQVRKLDTSEEVECYQLHEQPAEIRSLAFIANNRLAMGSSDSRIRIWDLAEKRCIHTLEHGGVFETMAVSADGCRLVSAGHEGWKVWNLDTCLLERTFKGYGIVFCLALSKDGRLALAGTKDLIVEVWDAIDWQLDGFLEGHDNSIFGLALSPDGTRLVSASDDLYIWDVNQVRKTNFDSWSMQRGHKIMVNSIALNRTGEKAISGSWDGTLRLWDVSNGNELSVFPSDMYPEYPYQVAYREDGCCIEIETWRGQIWDRQGNLTTIDPLPAFGVGPIALSGDGKKVMLGDADGHLLIWDFKIEGEVRELIGQSGHIYDIMMTYDGSRAVSSSGDGTVILWDLTRLVKLKQFTANASLVTTDGQRVLAAMRDNNLIAWDEEREIPHLLVGHADQINAMGITSDGRGAVSGSRDGTLIVWDLTRYREVAYFDEFKITALATFGNTLIAGNVIGSMYCLDIVIPDDRKPESNHG